MFDSHYYRSSSTRLQKQGKMSHYFWGVSWLLPSCMTGPHSTVGSTSDSRARGPRFDAWSSLMLSFLLPLIQDGQLSVTGESMCTKYWLTT